MRFIFYIAFFSFFIGFRQENNEVPVFEYEVNYNLGKALTKKGYVFSYNGNIFYNTSKSVFLEKSNRFSINEETGIPNITIRGAGDGSEYSISYIEKDSLATKYSLGNQLITTTEYLVIQNWKPTGKKKEVNGRDCIEVVTSFRGRDYIAYIDLTVPINYGPWKFNNFPGLPVLIHDTENKLKWTLSKISKESEAKIKKFIKEEKAYLSSLEQMTLKEFIELYDKTNNGFDMAVAKLPRDFKRANPRQKRKRGGLELKFEWDTQ